jgi:hypothetical protein
MVSMELSDKFRNRGFCFLEIRMAFFGEMKQTDAFFNIGKERER